MRAQTANAGTLQHPGHRVWKLGSDIDTDLLAPGHAMKYGIEKIATHCLETTRPEFASQVRAGDVIVAGSNFGIGSSREQAAAVLVKLGVAAVIAPSFSGLYFRNAFNVGLLLLTCADADQLVEAELLSLDTRLANAPCVTSSAGKRLACEPISEFLMTMVRNGGLMNQLRIQFGKEPEHV
jgi:3-isopropylmalate/(R)-2-methylmalate dehydratase small subunit